MNKLSYILASVGAFLTSGCCNPYSISLISFGGPSRLDRAYYAPPAENVRVVSRWRHYSDGRPDKLIWRGPVVVRPNDRYEYNQGQGMFGGMVQQSLDNERRYSY